jgi:hypothetical protein
MLLVILKADGTGIGKWVGVVVIVQTVTNKGCGVFRSYMDGVLDGTTAPKYLFLCHLSGMFVAAEKIQDINGYLMTWSLHATFLSCKASASIYLQGGAHLTTLLITDSNVTSTSKTGDIHSKWVLPLPWKGHVLCVWPHEGPGPKEEISLSTISILSTVPIFPGTKAVKIKPLSWCCMWISSGSQISWGFPIHKMGYQWPLLLGTSPRWNKASISGHLKPPRGSGPKPKSNKSSGAAT